MRLAARSASPLALALVAAWIGGSAVALAKEDEEEATPLSPEVEKKMTEAFDKMKEAKRSLWELGMRKEIEDLEKAAPLGVEGRKTLDAAAQKAISVCVDDWTVLTAAAFREQYGGQGDEMLNFYNQLVGQAEMYVKNDSWFAGEAMQPVEHPAWTGALRQTLPAERMAVVENVRAERNRKVGKEVADFLKANAEMARQQEGGVFTMWGDEIKSWLAVPKERAEQLDALAKTVSDEAVENGRKRAEKWLLFADEELRLQTVKQGRIYFRSSAKELKAQRVKWDQGLAKILPAEDVQRVKILQGDLKARRGVELGKVMLSLLDDRLALTAEQREKLRPIADRLVVKSPSFFPPNEVQNYYWNASPQLFYNAAGKATTEELAPILDGSQMARWKEACAQKNAQIRQVVVAGGSRVPEKNLPENAEPEDIESALSDILHEKTVAERERVLATNLLKVEDAARVAKLSPEVIARLETAARGVTEEMLVSWKTSVEQSAHGQGQATSPEALKAFFVNMRNANFQTGRDAAAEKNNVWEATVKAELTDAQRAAWQKEIDARGVLREKSVIGAVMAGFARRNTLTREQWDKLEPMVAGIIKEYSQDIGGMFSSSNMNRWYLQYYTMLTPLMGIPEEQLKEILGKERWQHWAESQEFANTMQYWKNIQSNHARRVEKKKE